MTFDFLPTWQDAPNYLLLFGVILLVGLLAGELAARTRVLPRITGYIAGGILLGPNVLDLLDVATQYQARLFVDIALGLILFDLGRRLDVQWLRHDRGLWLTAILEASLSFTLVYLGLTWIGISSLLAALAAAVGIATSPAVVMLVAHELGAEGPVTRRALALVAMNNVVSLLTVTALLTLLHLDQRAVWLTATLHPLYLIAGSTLLAAGVLAAMLASARLVGKNDTYQSLLQTGAIIFTVGISVYASLSVPLAVLALGILTRNLDRRHDLATIEFGRVGQIFFVPLFVLTGARLAFGDLTLVAGAASMFLLARFVGKFAALQTFAHASGIGFTQATQLSFTLVPMAGLAVGVTWWIADLYPEFGAHLTAIISASVTVLHIIGPVMTQFAFRWAGETTRR